MWGKTPKEPMVPASLFVTFMQEIVAEVSAHNAALVSQLREERTGTRTQIERLINEMSAHTTRMVGELAAQNERYLENLKGLLFPPTPVGMERGWLSEAQEDAQFAFEQGDMSESALKEILEDAEFVPMDEQ